MGNQIRRIKKRRQRRGALVEALESRLLLFSLSDLSDVINFTALPAFTNQMDMDSITALESANASDYWWLENTGQTLTDYEQGPATGTPGADLSMQKAWTLTTGRSEVVVAVLDSGLDMENGDLAGVLWTNPKETPDDGIDNDGNGYVDDVHGGNVLDGNGDITDDLGLGTAVAGAIHSVAPGVTLLPVKVGGTYGADTQAVIDGIDYIIGLKKAGAKILAINASYLSYYPATPEVAKAVKRAEQNGMMYIAAAGNDGEDLDYNIPGLASWLTKYISSVIPSNVILVGATDNRDNLASFSNYGARAVNIGAPGVDITVPIPGGEYAALTGTSLAAAMVTGTAALMKSLVPTASIGTIRNAILNSGDRVESLSGVTSSGRRVNAYKALEYLLGKKSPKGAVEAVTPTVISGWAFDANLGTAASSVQIEVDGKLFATVTADVTRDDLAGQLGSAGHGFTFDASTVPYGKHKIKVYAVDDGTLKRTLIGQGPLIMDTDPTGAVESAGAKVVTGWTFDSDTPGKYTQVKLYLDGKAWKTTSAKIARTDLASQFPTDPASITGVVRHGYSFNLGTLRAGIHRLDVYAVDTLTGLLTRIGTETVSSNQTATGAVEVLNASSLSGWAYDADARGSAIQIRYQIDDGAPVFVTAKVSRPDLQAQLGSKNHGFNVALPQLSAGEHALTVSAVDPNNKMLVLLDSRTLTVSAPLGNPLPAGTVEFSGNQITGTVTDGEYAGPIPIRVTIDMGTSKPKTYTTTATSDGAGHLTFAWTLPVLTGPRRVDVWALDDQTTVPVLLAHRLVNYTAPSATVESFTADGAVGVAIALSAPKGLAMLRLDVDGLAGNLVTAKLARPDQLAVLGRSKVGYSILMPKLAPGDHTGRLYLVDPTTLAATLLDTLSFSTT